MSTEVHDFQTPNQFTYEGIFLPGHMTGAPKVVSFPFRSDDIIVASYPKSGTSWVQTIVYLICHLEDVKNGKVSRRVDEFVRFIELQRPSGPSEMQILENTKSPRGIKTHMQAQIIWKSLEKIHPRVIVIQRNPKDVLVSFYYFYRMNKALSFPGTWNEFFDLAMRNKLIFGNAFDHNLGWWRKRNEENVLLLKYEDMKEDTAAAVQAIAKHLGKTLNDAELAGIVKLCSFEAMKNDPNTNMTHHQHFGPGQVPFDFLRKGEVGDWKNYFTVAQDEIITNVIEARLTPEGLTFRYE